MAGGAVFKGAAAVRAARNRRRVRLRVLCASAWLLAGLAPLSAQETAADGGGGDRVQQLIERQRGMLRIGRSSCPQDSEQIVVCGRRDPDRFRVPPGDGPRGPESAVAERDQLLGPACANVGGRGCGPNLIPVLTVTADGVKWGPPKQDR